MQAILNHMNINQYGPLMINWASNLVAAIIILLVGIWFAGRVKKWIIAVGQKSPHLDETVFRFLSSIARYLILIFVVVAVLNCFGVQTASIIALLGAAGLAVGLALQGTLSNLAAGVMLLIFRPYKIGDLIEAAGNIGVVTGIDIFTTLLKTGDNQHIVIPNGKIWGDQIINHSHYDVRGVTMTFGIGYDDDIDQARTVINAVLAQHPLVLKEPAPLVEVETLNDSSVDFIVRPFCQKGDMFKIKTSLPELIKKAFDANNIGIPYPHQRLILVNENK